jgi:peptidoglycan hydrolase-like protein with peptidoglycan-binding domain
MREAAAAAPPPPANLPPYPGFFIALGSAGNHVLTIQQALNRIAPRYPSIPAVAADGIFGTGTRGAVMAFQRQFGLSPDGIVGQQTWERLMLEAAIT